MVLLPLLKCLAVRNCQRLIENVRRVVMRTSSESEWEIGCSRLHWWGFSTQARKAVSRQAYQGTPELGVALVNTLGSKRARRASFWG